MKQEWEGIVDSVGEHSFCATLADLTDRTSPLEFAKGRSSISPERSRTIAWREDGVSECISVYAADNATAFVLNGTSKSGREYEMTFKIAHLALDLAVAPDNIVAKWIERFDRELEAAA